jgi:hypothetical protein
MIFLWKLTFFTITTILSISLLSDQLSNHSSYALSESLKSCGYTVIGTLFYNSGVCVDQGTPTVISKAKSIPQENLNLLLDYDKKLYSYIVTPYQCLVCGPPKIPESCKYDDKGNFIPTLTESQKKVIEDMNKTYSLQICPFKIHKE